MLGLLAFAALAVVVNTGCATLPAEGAYWRQVGFETVTTDTDAVQTPSDRQHTHRMALRQDARGIVEDIDFIMLRERPSRLSRWHTR
jgi:hypothetical protein